MTKVDDPMAAEFDTVAEWTAQVAEALGPEYAVPAGCRGSGQRAAGSRPPWTGCLTGCTRRAERPDRPPAQLGPAHLPAAHPARD
jgi:hypothetical protein